MGLYSVIIGGTIWASQMSCASSLPQGLGSYAPAMALPRSEPCSAVSLDTLVTWRTHLLTSARPLLQPLLPSTSLALALAISLSPHTSPRSDGGCEGTIWWRVPENTCDFGPTKVGDDEEKAQKLSMHPPGGRHDAGQEGIGGTIAVGDTDHSLCSHRPR